jgi:hypothetical protein
VFSYETKAAAASKLIIPVRFGNNTNPEISKASILPFSLKSRVILPLFKYLFNHLPL